MNTQYINLDISKAFTPNRSITIGQGDLGGTTIVATIYDNGSLLSLSGLSARFFIRLPESVGYVEDENCTVSGNTITYVVDEEHCAYMAGVTQDAYFALYSGTTRIYSTARFTVKILQSAADGVGIAGSWNNDIQQAVADMNAATDEARQAVSDISEALSTAEAAVESASQASTNAETAVSRANAAVSSANTAVSNANAAATSANNAATNANSKAASADAATNTALAAASNANGAAASARQDSSTMISQVNQAITRANTAADNANYVASETEGRIEAAIATVTDLSQLLVPLMSEDTRGGAKLGDGLAVDDNTLHVGQLAKVSTGEVYGPLASVTAKGHAEQFSTTGKNLFDASKSISGSSVTVIKGSSFITVTATVASGSYAYKRISNLTEGMTFAFSFDTESTDYRVDLSARNSDGTILETVTITRGNKSGVITIPTGTANLLIILFPRYSETGAVGDSVTYRNPQLELGSVATEYEPYTGGAPSPSPDYPQEIQVVRGRNLLDEANTTWIVGSYINSSGNVDTTSGANYMYEPEYIEVDCSESYLIQFVKTSSASVAASIAFYDSSKVFIFRPVAIQATTATGIVFGAVTAPSNARYARISIAKDALQIQLTLGSTPQPYVPYGHVGLDQIYADETDIVQGMVNMNGVESAATYRVCVPRFKVNIGDTYLLSVDSANSNIQVYEVNFFAEDGTYLGYKSIQAKSTLLTIEKGPYVIPVMRLSNNADLTPSDVTYFRFMRTTPIPLPQRGWVAGLPDGTADALRLDGAGKVTWEEKTGELTLNGGMITVASSSPSIFAKSYPEIKISAVRYAVMLTSFKSADAYWSSLASGQANITAGLFAESLAALVVSDDRFTNASDLNAWLASNPVTVLYPLATPVIEECGYVDLPDIPSEATVTIPELEELGMTFWVDGDGTIRAAMRDWYERAHSEYADRLTALEEAVAALVTQ